MKPNLNAMIFNALKLYGLISFLKFSTDIAKDCFTLKKVTEKPILEIDSRVFGNFLPG